MYNMGGSRCILPVKKAKHNCFEDETASETTTKRETAVSVKLFVPWDQVSWHTKGDGGGGGGRSFGEENTKEPWVDVGALR